MNYQQALEAVMAGKRVRRASWDRPFKHIVHISRIHEDWRDAWAEQGGWGSQPSQKAELIRIDGGPDLVGGWDRISHCGWWPEADDIVAEDWELLELSDDLEHADPFT